MYFCGKDAKIHEVVTTLFPMKKSGNTSYFDGDFSDSNKKMRLYGFESAVNVRRKLMEFDGKETGVMLSKCEVKPSRGGGDLEIKVD